MAYGDIPTDFLDKVQKIFEISEDGLDGYKDLDEALVEIHTIIEELFEKIQQEE